MYYLRTKAATDAIKFTLDKTKLAQPAAAQQPAEAPAAMTDEAAAQIACSLDNPDSCERCGA
jgi:ribonucleoside-diphosphate reductase alpha chain